MDLLSFNHVWSIKGPKCKTHRSRQVEQQKANSKTSWSHAESKIQNSSNKKATRRAQKKANQQREKKNTVLNTQERFIEQNTGVHRKSVGRRQRQEVERKRLIYKIQWKIAESKTQTMTQLTTLSLCKLPDLKQKQSHSKVKKFFILHFSAQKDEIKPELINSL